MKNKFKEGAQVLRIYTAGKDQLGGLPLYEAIVQLAARNGISGATVFRGIGGFCSTNPVLAPELMRIEINQPVIVEMVDTEEKLCAFADKINDIMPRGLMTLQPILYRFYGKDRKKVLTHD